MGLQKVFQARSHHAVLRLWRGILFTAFLYILCQGARFLIISQSQSGWLCNPSGAFGIFTSSFTFFLFALLALLFMALQWWQEDRDIVKEWPWLLLIAGGLSNLWERIKVGCVVDYLTLPFIPTFNLADVMLTVGVVGIFWNWYVENNKFKITSSK